MKLTPVLAFALATACTMPARAPDAEQLREEQNAKEEREQRAAATAINKQYRDLEDAKRIAAVREERARLEGEDLLRAQAEARAAAASAEHDARAAEDVRWLGERARNIAARDAEREADCVSDRAERMAALRARQERYRVSAEKERKLDDYARVHCRKVDGVEPGRVYTDEYGYVRRTEDMETIRLACPPGAPPELRNRVVHLPRSVSATPLERFPDAEQGLTRRDSWCKPYDEAAVRNAVVNRPAE